ncbi:MAG: hypothetical protein ACJ8GK_12015 [Luteimonas sp.]
MRDAPAPMTEQQAAARRRGVRRTVLLFACIALAVYLAFVATGLLTHGTAR